MAGDRLCDHGACGTALSLPCGFTRENLPVGLQIAGPPRSEARILAAAKALEDISA